MLVKGATDSYGITGFVRRVFEGFRKDFIIKHYKSNPQIFCL